MAARKGTPQKLTKSLVVQQIPAACSDEAKAVEFLERQRGWDDSPACPRCGDTNVKQMKGRDGERNKRFLWDCRGCRQQYTVRIGTVFEDSRIPLRHWCYGFWAACASKKGVSALQIQRQTGLSYKSALFLMHRIRYAMAEEPGAPLSGIVEADETYIGGKPRNKFLRPGMKRSELRKRGRPADFADRKFPVMAMVERGGRVRAVVPPDVRAETVGSTLRRYVEPSAHLMTDESPVYIGVGREYFRRHDSTNHTRGQYVKWRDGVTITSNTVEGFFSLIKRGVTGTYHYVSRKHLHRYVSEFEFRYNTRHMNDGDRIVRAIQGAEGKRLRVGYVA